MTDYNTSSNIAFLFSNASFKIRGSSLIIFCLSIKVSKISEPIKLTQVLLCISATAPSTPVLSGEAWHALTFLELQCDIHPSKLYLNLLCCSFFVSVDKKFSSIFVLGMALQWQF